MKMPYLICYLWSIWVYADSGYVDLEVFYPDKPDKPCVYIEVEGRKFLSLFDLGAEHEFAFDRSTLTELVNKEPFDKSKFMGFHGIVREEIEYYVPQVKLGSHIFKNVIVAGLDENSWGRDRKYMGLVGNKILEKGNLLVDFSQSKVRFIPHADDQTLIDGNINSWKKIQFERKKLGIFLVIVTDVGEARFLLDTGAPCTIIDQSFLQDVEKPPAQPNIEYTSAKFELGGFDFGQQKMLGIKWKKISDEQGILGMDFLKKHVIYIDYPNKVLYIKP